MDDATVPLSRKGWAGEGGKKERTMNKHHFIFHQVGTDRYTAIFSCQYTAIFSCQYKAIGTANSVFN